MLVKLKWVTPNAEQLLGHMARVSNPAAVESDDAAKLIKYLIDHKHWSPFEMVDACVEIHTSRDISRQILRHRSFSFQEFSGRYAAYENLLGPREARLQDTKNRQNSLPCVDPELIAWWEEVQKATTAYAAEAYEEALKRGLAKEQARAILPEGLTPTRMYMKGSLRSWLHYWAVRIDPATQKEHRDVAQETYNKIIGYFPNVRLAIKNG